MKDFYEVIFKRKSMRKFDSSLSLTQDDLEAIKAEAVHVIPLDGSIKIRMEIKKRGETSARFGEYCLLLYSEKKPFYLLNAGYMLEQMDLYIAMHDIGACWYGLARTKEKKLDGLDYVIMLAFGKSRPEDFRSDPSAFNRKAMDDIWTGEFDDEVKTAVRLAPSACNSQPWRISCNQNIIQVYRRTDVVCFIPPFKIPYYNTIDMGICLYFLETAMLHKGYQFERTLINEEKAEDSLLKVATYTIK